MPNAPCMIRQGATAFVLGTHAVERDAQKVIMLMSSVGEHPWHAADESLKEKTTPAQCIHLVWTAEQSASLAQQPAGAWLVLPPEQWKPWKCSIMATG